MGGLPFYAARLFGMKPGLRLGYTEAVTKLGAAGTPLAYPLQSPVMLELTARQPADPATQPWLERAENGAHTIRASLPRAGGWDLQVAHTLPAMGTGAVAAPQNFGQVEISLSRPGALPYLALKAEAGPASLHFDDLTIAGQKVAASPERAVRAISVFNQLIQQDGLDPARVTRQAFAEDTRSVRQLVGSGPA